MSMFRCLMNGRTFLLFVPKEVFALTLNQQDHWFRKHGVEAVLGPADYRTEVKYGTKEYTRGKYKPRKKKEHGQQDQTPGGPEVDSVPPQTQP